MTAGLDKNTILCMSLSGRPSNIGTRFHNYLYAELGLNFVYKAFTTDDLPAAVAGIRALGIRGCGVSMPYKEQVIEHVDVMHPSATAIDSVNTIVNESGVLHGYNTDYQAVLDLLREHAVDTGLPVVVSGSGGMAKAVVAAVRDAGFVDVTVVARNERAGSALAQQYGFRWQSTLGDLRPGMLINATPIGMSGGPDAAGLSFPEDAVRAADIVFDVVAMPAHTPVITLATELGKTVVTGASVIALQAAEQFVLYTGVRPTAEHIRQASEYSRA